MMNRGMDDQETNLQFMTNENGHGIGIQMSHIVSIPIELIHIFLGLFECPRFTDIVGDHDNVSRVVCGRSIGFVLFGQFE